MREHSKVFTVASGEDGLINFEVALQGGNH
jgi:hypothetical protein